MATNILSNYQNRESCVNRERLHLVVSRIPEGALALFNLSTPPAQSSCFRRRLRRPPALEKAMSVSAAAKAALSSSTPESPTRIRLRRAEAEGDRRRETDENIRRNLSAVRRVAGCAPDVADNDH